MMTYLFLVRHGENDWVGTHRLAGRSAGVHLNEKGRQQAAALAEWLQKQPLTAIYSSPLERCMETAQPLADALSLPVISETGILEVDYGEWQAASLKDLSKLPEWRLVQTYPSGFRFPGGETLREVQSRAIETLDCIRARHPGAAIVVFSHGDVVRTALAHYLGIPLDLFQRIQISTASVSVIGFHQSGPYVFCMNYLGEMPVLKLESEEEKAEKESPAMETQATSPNGSESTQHV